MFNGIKKSKLAKLIYGLMLVSITLSFSGGILESARSAANRKPVKSTNQALTKAANTLVKQRTKGQRQEYSKANPAMPIFSAEKKYNMDQSGWATNVQDKSKTQTVNSVATNATWKQTTSKVQTASQKSSWSIPKTTVDLNLLARVIYAESRGEPFKGQVAVGAVLLNRLEDSRFPKNLSQIIFKQGEFCTVRDGQIWKTPNQQAVQAARLAVAGWDPTGGALYFYNPAKTTSRWIWSRPIVNKIGNHIFAI